MCGTKLSTNVKVATEIQYVNKHEVKLTQYYEQSGNQQINVEEHVVAEICITLQCNKE